MNQQTNEKGPAFPTDTLRARNDIWASSRRTHFRWFWAHKTPVNKSMGNQRNKLLRTKDRIVHKSKAEKEEEMKKHAFYLCYYVANRDGETYQATTSLPRGPAPNSNPPRVAHRRRMRGKEPHWGKHTQQARPPDRVSSPRKRQSLL